MPNGSVKIMEMTFFFAEEKWLKPFAMECVV